MTDYSPLTAEQQDRLDQIKAAVAGMDWESYMIPVDDPVVQVQAIEVMNVLRRRVRRERLYAWLNRHA